MQKKWWCSTSQTSQTFPEGNQQTVFLSATVEIRKRLEISWDIFLTRARVKTNQTWVFTCFYQTFFLTIVFYHQTRILLIWWGCNKTKKKPPIVEILGDDTQPEKSAEMRYTSIYGDFPWWLCVFNLLCFVFGRGRVGGSSFRFMRYDHVLSPFLCGFSAMPTSHRGGSEYFVSFGFHKPPK